MDQKRRSLVLSIVGLLAVSAALFALPKQLLKYLLVSLESSLSPRRKNTSDQKSAIYLAKNGTPQNNIVKVVDMMGGIDRFIGINDIVIIKPNAQWWNQGRTNLAAMKAFIELILGIPAFKGEIIIAENQHFMDDSLPEKEKDNVRGWIKFGEINGDINGVNHNLNTLVELFQNRGFQNVTKSHWRDGGPKEMIWCNAQNGGIVRSPAEGDGYVWTDDDYTLEGLWGLKKWKVKMTYPVFTSSYSGVTIDFKNGAYQRDGKGSGRYLDKKPIKFINFSALNDHGSDTGLTAAIKNYMGVTDLSCGWWGLEPKGYVMVHECGSDFYPYGKAGPLGHFMKKIRKADLNIVTAEWVGWGSRTDITKATQMRTILAGIDPIALDFYGAKHILYPLSKISEHHDPDNPKSAIAKFLNLAQQSYGSGALDDTQLKIHQYDFLNN